MHRRGACRAPTPSLMRRLSGEQQPLSAGKFLLVPGVRQKVRQTDRETDRKTECEETTEQSRYGGTIQAFS
ncbi:hypothetical protein NQZ68_034594 [Dissostichus eleginoides]|nr:hypothetical protein NQZ68_034594 [Dissostichus eleginoides]